MTFTVESLTGGRAMSAKHTETPWKLAVSGLGKLKGVVQPPAILDAQGNYLAVLGGGSIHFQDAAANAAFIVQTVNAHAALLAAMKDAIYILSPVECASETEVNTQICGISVLRAAIALAEKEGGE